MSENEDQKNIRLSKDVVNQLAVIIKTSHIHDPSNVAVVSALKRLVELIKILLEAGPLNLELVGDFFYLNGTRVKFAMEYLVNFDYVVREFKKLGLGSITFMVNVNLDDIQVFIREFIAASFSKEPFNDFSGKMKGVDSIKVGPLKKIKDEDDVEVDTRQVVKKTYFNAVSVTKGVLNKIKSGGKVNIKRSKRAVQSLVDTLFNEEELLIGMTAIKDYDDYTYHHSVNVSILSISLGQRIGFSKDMLLELGIVSLFHDLGKIEIPPEVLNKPSSFTDEEWSTVRRHPFWGLKAVLNMKALDTMSIRTAIVSFEHHLHLDYSGYPKGKSRHPLDLYSKIVSIADQYDGMTSARVYSRTPMSPDKALSLMMERTGNQLDPLLMKFFINMVGVYPVGTAVLLSSRELGLVYSNNIMFPDKPKVMIISDQKGNKIESFTVDLTEKVASGKYKRAIIKPLDPHKYRINLAEYLL
jgi:HD-GYP domain-containing protein (c-di-GMP phosphodiesterase class II)